MAAQFPSRRHFLQSAGAVSLGFAGLRSMLDTDALAASRDDAEVGYGFGRLISDPANILDLPKGFSCRVVSRASDTMDDCFVVPGNPDGMAAFPGPDGRTILIRNHENDPARADIGPFGADDELLKNLDPKCFYDIGEDKIRCLGGTTNILFNTKTQKVERQVLSLAGTINNCAGGPTPWNTWITCEETEYRAEEGLRQHHGYAFEVPATMEGLPVKPVPLSAMGRFRREAVAVDPRTGIVYQTEDQHDGVIYRFIPKEPGNLHRGGKLQALAIRDQQQADVRNWFDEHDQPMGPTIRVGQTLAVRWLDVDDVHGLQNDLRYRMHQLGAARFARAEGMWYGRGVVYFACTNGGRALAGHIWKYTPSPVEGTGKEDSKPGQLELFLEPNDPGLLENADNLTVAPWGDLIVCEDGTGDQYLVGVTPEGSLYKFARNATDVSEFAGAVFSPDGSTLFVNLQEGGLTLAITGPWRQRIG